jgi:hypothetical protein
MVAGVTSCVFGAHAEIATNTEITTDGNVVC